MTSSSCELDACKAVLKTPEKLQIKANNWAFLRKIQRRRVEGFVIRSAKHKADKLVGLVDCSVVYPDVSDKFII